MASSWLMVKMLLIFVGEHRFKRSPVQVEVEHIRGGKSWRGKGADKQFVNGAVPLDADYGRRGGGAMGSDHQAHLGSGWCQKDGWTIVKSKCHPAFWMGAYM